MSGTSRLVRLRLGAVPWLFLLPALLIFAAFKFVPAVRAVEMSFHEVTTLTAMGMPGVWTWKFGEGFGHHYLDSVAMNHNAIGRGYETFGNATAETVTRTLEADDLTREWYRPNPPYAEVEWSMRNNTNYSVMR